MKKAFFIVFILTTILSCKNETKEVKEEIKTLKGNYVFYDDAAVLQTNSEIYGVFLTNKTQELNRLTEKHKTKPTDMVTVELKVKITNKKDDKILWDNKIEIIEILKVN
ncbi:hypothetical protein [Thalassobellus sediminis]|uniref:hypothetical protein n=1 Tax=Thalassobellus sediminis TaxID=3367753 RepID=UPI0037B535D2